MVRVDRVNRHVFNLLNKQIQMDKGKITIDHQDYHSLDLSQLISGVYL